MKRLTYISKTADSFYPSDILEIAEVSEKNNRRDELGGVLFCFRNIFYQTLEGDEQKVDACFQRISEDKRHKDIFVVEIENNVEDRKFADWGMKTVKLDERNESLIQPIRNMLDSIARTHSFLRKYVPAKILNDIQSGQNLLEQKFQKSEKIVLFSDMYNSTSLAEVLPLEKMSDILNTYYEICNNTIIAHGGLILKLTGDGLMAYFAPENAENAAKACLEILAKLKQYRHEADGMGRYLYAGFGLSLGTVFEGNIGSDLRRDYTLIGDTVNIGSRLENLTRRLKIMLVINANIAERLKNTMNVKKLGMYEPRGRQAKIEIFTIDEPQVYSEEVSSVLKEQLIEAAARKA